MNDYIWENLIDHERYMQKIQQKNKEIENLKWEVDLLEKQVKKCNEQTDVEYHVLRLNNAKKVIITKDL